MSEEILTVLCERLQRMRDLLLTVTRELSEEKLVWTPNATTPPIR